MPSGNTRHRADSAWDLREVGPLARGSGLCLALAPREQTGRHGGAGAADEGERGHAEPPAAAVDLALGGYNSQLTRRKTRILGGLTPIWGHFCKHSFMETVYTHTTRHSPVQQFRELRSPGAAPVPPQPLPPAVPSAGRGWLHRVKAGTVPRWACTRPGQGQAAPRSQGAQAGAPEAAT